MKKRNLIHKQLLTSLFLLLSLVFYGCGAKSKTPTAETAYQTVTIENGVLGQTISGIGSVRAKQSVRLTWATSGIVAEILVTEGQIITAGDQLANLNQASLPQNVILARADYLNALTALDAFYETYAELAIATAEKAVADADAALNTAEYRWQTLNTPAQTTDIDQAFADVVLAQENLERARRNYAPYANKHATNVTRAQLLASVADAEEIYNSALRTYNYLRGDATDLQVSQSLADLTIAQQDLLNAQQELARIVAGPTEAEIAAQEAQIAAALATLNQSFITASFSGTITQVSAQVGDIVNSGDLAFQLDDLKILYADVNINEIDIAQLAVGQSASIQFDALKGVTFEGQVVKIGLNGDDSNGVVVYPVTVEVLNADENIKMGMTAEVNITVNESEAALLVPNEAVRLVDGKQVIYLLDKTKGIYPISIQLGASSDTHSVVLAGKLKAGDTIVLNPTQFEAIGGEKVNIKQEKVNTQK